MAGEVLLPDFTLQRALDETKRELRRGAVDGKHAFHYFSLATADSERVSQRTVVLREIDKKFHFYIYTDKRTEKIKQLQESRNRCSALFYNPKKKFQVEIKGTVHLHENDAVAKEKFATLSPRVHQDYNAAMPPGTGIEEPDVAEQLRQKDAFENFCILRLVPLEMDVLQLRKEGHVRALFHRDEEEWMMSWLLP